MCTNCIYIIKKFESFINFETSRKATKLYEAEDMANDFYVKYFSTKKNNPDDDELLSINKSYIKKAILTCMGDFKRKNKLKFQEQEAEINPLLQFDAEPYEYNQNNLDEEKHQQYILERKSKIKKYTKLIKKIEQILRSNSFDDELIETFISRSEGENLDQYMLRMNRVLLRNTASQNRKRAVEEIAKFIKSRPEFLKDALELGLNSEFECITCGNTLITDNKNPSIRSNLNIQTINNNPSHVRKKLYCNICSMEKEFRLIS